MIMDSKLLSAIRRSPVSSDLEEDEISANNENQSPQNELMVAVRPGAINVNTPLNARVNVSTPMKKRFFPYEYSSNSSLKGVGTLPSPIKISNITADTKLVPQKPLAPTILQSFRKRPGTPNSLPSDNSSTSSSTPSRVSLSRSADSGDLHSAFKKVKENLNRSCFADFRGHAHDQVDSDLTCLNWLQEGNLLNGFTPCSNKEVIDGEQKVEKYDPELSLNSSDPLNLISEVDKSLRKPPYSFSTLIFMAIENSENKMLAVKDIYQWIQDTFPYFQKAPIGWKNSVRHNLSLNKSFKKVEKVRLWK